MNGAIQSYNISASALGSRFEESLIACENYCHPRESNVGVAIHKWRFGNLILEI